MFDKSWRSLLAERTPVVFRTDTGVGVGTILTRAPVQTGVMLTFIQVLVTESASVSRVTPTLKPCQVVRAAPVKAGLGDTVISVHLAPLPLPPRVAHAAKLIKEVLTSAPIEAGV